MVEFEFIIHSTLNTISGIVLLLIGIVILSRNRKLQINQLLFGFFFGLAIYELFDGFSVGFRRDPSLDFLNILRDIALVALIFALGIILLAVLVIYYGEATILQIKWIILWGILVIIVMISAIIGETIPQSSLRPGPPPFYLTVIIERNLVGLVSIIGTIIAVTILCAAFLANQIRQSEMDQIRKKSTRFLLGFVTIMIIILVLDLRLIFSDIRMIIAGNDPLHILIHIILLTGEILVLSAFWTPFSKQVETSTAAPG